MCSQHRGAFCQFPFRWIHYYGSNKSSGKETGKTHLCALCAAAPACSPSALSVPMCATAAVGFEKKASHSISCMLGGPLTHSHTQRRRAAWRRTCCRHDGDGLVKHTYACCYRELATCYSSFQTYCDGATLGHCCSTAAGASQQSPDPPRCRRRRR